MTPYLTQGSILTKVEYLPVYSAWRSRVSPATAPNQAFPRSLVRPRLKRLLAAASRRPTLSLSVCSSARLLLGQAARCQLPASPRFILYLRPARQPRPPGPTLYPVLCSTAADHIFPRLSVFFEVGIYSTTCATASCIFRSLHRPSLCPPRPPATSLQHPRWRAADDVLRLLRLTSSSPSEWLPL